MKKYNLRLKYGTFAKDGDENVWREGLDETLAGDKGLADFKDLNGLAKAYLDTKSDLGRSIRLPGSDAGEDALVAFHQSLTEKVPGLTPMPDLENAESVTAFMKRLGMPEEASGYDAGEIPESLKESMLAFQAAAHGSDLTKKQFDVLSKFLVTENADADAASVTANQAEQDKLKLDWGETLGNKSQAILELMKQTGAPDSLVDKITGHKMDMASMKWFNGLVEALSGEGGQMDFQGGQHEDGRVTPDEAKTQINEIMGNKKSPYWDASDPQHAALVKKVVELQKQAIAA